MQSPSLFTQIINGDIPCHKVYEDDKTFAFLDIHPAVEGHVLVIPKSEVEFVWDLSDADYLALNDTVRKVALRLRSVLGKPYAGAMIVGTDIPHAHVHVVAFETATEVHEVLLTRDSVETDHTALAQLAIKIAF
jgi:histidine triad (HIT) family protein